jgi:very-short-patch-repair endonuclease
LCFIAVVVIHDRMLAARYRRHYTISIEDYRWDARQLRRKLAKLDALLWGNIRRYNYFSSLHFDD